MLQMACPVAQSTVSEVQADRAVKHVLQNSQASVIGLVQVPLDGLLLQAATLGLKTFSNTADAVVKSIKINGDAQARLSDKKIADYQDQLAKAREQEHQSKKAKFWSAIFSPITTVLKVVFKPVVDLLKKIPGLEQAFNWLQKNISELALPLAIISSLVCPMSLPMTLGLLAVTSATAGFSIANKIMGDKAPQWLKITDQVGDMLAGISFMFSAVGMLGCLSKVKQIAGGLSKVNQMAGSLGKVSQMAGRLFDFLGSKADSLQLAVSIFNSVTAVGDGVSQYLIGQQLAKSQKDMGYIEASIGLDEAQVKWLQHAQNTAVNNLETILNRSAIMSESASKSISESGSLRARLSNSIV